MSLTRLKRTLSAALRGRHENDWTNCVGVTAASVWHWSLEAQRPCGRMWRPSLYREPCPTPLLVKADKTQDGAAEHKAARELGGYV